MKLITRRNLKLVSGFILIAALGSLSAQDEEIQGKIRQGYAIAPVPLKLARLNPALVGLGSYLVNAGGGCNDCHTNPSYLQGGDPFAGQPEMINTTGYLAGGTPFGPFVSRNLTPDGSGNPAGLTLEQFFQEMRHGSDLKNLPPNVPSPAMDLLQVMPWPVYGKMVDNDLRAIYEYLRAIPCVEGGPGNTTPRC